MKASLNSGTLSPNPWDLTLSGQNGWPYTEGTRTEDKAPQGCDLSTASSAGMAVGGVRAERNPMVDYDRELRRVWGATNGHRCGRRRARFSDRPRWSDNDDFADVF